MANQTSVRTGNTTPINPSRTKLAQCSQMSKIIWSNRPLTPSGKRGSVPYCLISQRTFGSTASARAVGQFLAEYYMYIPGWQYVVGKHRELITPHHIRGIQEKLLVSKGFTVIQHQFVIDP